MDGVKNVDVNHLTYLTRVTFDRSRVSAEEIVEELGKQGFEVQGEPTYID
jgi:copper chaperone CopZ